MMPQAATAEHRGDGVDRRNAHHERSARERSEREAGMRAFEPPPDEEGAVEHLSASVVLAAVEESGPNYLLPKAPEPVKSRRKRLMVDEAARQAGQGRAFLISRSVGGRAASGWRAGGRFEKQKTENKRGPGGPGPHWE